MLTVRTNGVTLRLWSDGVPLARVSGTRYLPWERLEALDPLERGNPQASPGSETTGRAKFLYRAPRGRSQGDPLPGAVATSEGGQCERSRREV